MGANAELGVSWKKIADDVVAGVARRLGVDESELGGTSGNLRQAVINAAQRTANGKAPPVNSKWVHQDSPQFVWVVDSVNESKGVARMVLTSIDMGPDGVADVGYGIGKYWDFALFGARVRVD